MKTFIADSSAWIWYFDANPRLKPFFDENRIETPASAVAEIKRVLRKRGHIPQTVQKALDTVIRRSLILELTADQAAKAGEIAFTRRMHLLDAFVYAHASESKTVLTADKDFKGKPFVELVE